MNAADMIALIHNVLSIVSMIAGFVKTISKNAHGSARKPAHKGKRSNRSNHR